MIKFFKEKCQNICAYKTYTLYLYRQNNKNDIKY